VLALFLATAGLARAAVLPQPNRTVVYKTIGDVTLRLHVFEPANLPPGGAAPAIVFFFGGGWQSGTPEQFYPHCAHFAARGMVAMAAEYRIASKHHTTPRECVMDGKSCLRWLHAHSAELHIDPARIAAGGGSAGGHVAMAVATLPGLDEPGEDRIVSCQPAALVLFNPVIDNGPGGYGYERVKDYYREISPLHTLRAGLPPTLLMFGTKDKYVPVATAEKFQRELRARGNRCELRLYADQAHGFFNFNDGRNPFYDQTVKAADAFLVSVGLLAPPPAP
jgi:acetyl esterase/lipase